MPVGKAPYMVSSSLGFFVSSSSKEAHAACNAVLPTRLVQVYGPELREGICLGATGVLHPYLAAYVCTIWILEPYGLRTGLLAYARFGA